MTSSSRIHTQRKPASAIELKSAALTLICVVLKSADLAEIATEVAAQFGDAADQLERDPVVVDVSALREHEQALDLLGVIATLRGVGMNPIALKGASPELLQKAKSLGLMEVPEGMPSGHRRAAEALAPEAEPEIAKVDAVLPIAVAPLASAGTPTMVLDRPLRSGQQVYARGADLVVMAAVSFGAEVIADGNVHIYAPLRGRAIAGARGNVDARIFTTCMEAQLVSVAGTYRTCESDLPANVQGKPAQVRLEGDRLVIEPIAV